MDLFARNDGEHYLCGLIDGPCQIVGLDLLVQDAAHGAIAQFFGVVRNHNEGLSAEAVDYDVHPELALKALDELCKLKYVGPVTATAILGPVFPQYVPYAADAGPMQRRPA